MNAPESGSPRQSLRRRAEIWREAESELIAEKVRDAAASTSQDAIRQLFAGMERLLVLPSSRTSGLIEQQMWFSRIREDKSAVPHRPNE